MNKNFFASLCRKNAALTISLSLASSLSLANQPPLTANTAENNFSTFSDLSISSNPAAE
ncbi:MAG TPA: hypothetical protein VHE99_12120 [Gammaproteobacteria bacterium]|nr:hypothetical protein [Gammaproteobacteria bacterium]